MDFVGYRTNKGENQEERLKKMVIIRQGYHYYTECIASNCNSKRAIVRVRSQTVKCPSCGCEWELSINDKRELRTVQGFRPRKTREEIDIEWHLKHDKDDTEEFNKEYKKVMKQEEK